MKEGEHLDNTKRVSKSIVGAFNLKGAAEYAGVSAPTMLEWVNRSDFPAFRSGRRWVIPCEAFTRWLNEQAKARACIE